MNSEIWDFEIDKIKDAISTRKAINELQKKASNCVRLFNCLNEGMATKAQEEFDCYQKTIELLEKGLLVHSDNINDVLDKIIRLLEKEMDEIKEENVFEKLIKKIREGGRGKS